MAGDAMRAGLSAVTSGLAVTAVLVCGTAACGHEDDRVVWGHGGDGGGATGGVVTVDPEPSGATGLRRALAHVRTSPATRLGFEYGSALRAPIDPRADLTPYGYGELGVLGRRLAAPLGFSASGAATAFTAGTGATAAGGLLGHWNPGTVRARLTALGARVSPGHPVTRYALPHNAEFPLGSGTSTASPRPVTLPPVLRYIGVSSGLVAYGGNPGALADVTEAHADTLARTSPFRELSACLGDVRAAIITPGRIPYAAGTRVRDGHATNVLCALPARDVRAAALARGIRARAATFTVTDGDDVRPLPASTRIEVIRGPGHPVRVRVDDAHVNGDAFLRCATDGDLMTLVGG